MRETGIWADNYPNMGPIEILVAGIFTMVFVLIGIFWVGSDERPAKYDHRNTRQG
jgi:hypothetical protein